MLNFVMEHEHPQQSAYPAHQRRREQQVTFADAPVASLCFMLINAEYAENNNIPYGKDGRDYFKMFHRINPKFYFLSSSRYL
jgi:hypothetical protein